jgi:hypothetical protein
MYNCFHGGNIEDRCLFGYDDAVSVLTRTTRLHHIREKRAFFIVKAVKTQTSILLFVLSTQLRNTCVLSM